MDWGLNRCFWASRLVVIENDAQDNLMPSRKDWNMQ